MKLIVKEYLSSLNERKELDVLLPNLLAMMGLDVFQNLVLALGNMVLMLLHLVVLMVNLKKSIYFQLKQVI